MLGSILGTEDDASVGYLKRSADEFNEGITLNDTIGSMDGKVDSELDGKAVEMTVETRLGIASRVML